MAQPSSYDRQINFALFSAESPADPHSGVDIDTEFNAVKVALDETQDALAGIMDDDGRVKRGSVGRAQLDSSITLGVAPPELWVTNTAYDADVSVVFNDLVLYICVTSHTSGTFATDLAAGKWTVLADFSATAAIEAGSITTAKLADGAVTEDKLGSSAITTVKISNANVTEAKIASGAVTETKIGTGAVTETKLGDSAVAAAKIATSAVTTTKIADSNVTTAKIADSNVTTAKIADSNVTTAKIADGNVTAAKIASAAVAAKSDMEAQTAGTLVVTPSKVVNHPGVAKAYGFVAVAGTATLSGGFGVSSVSRLSAGVVQVNFSTAFANSNYVVLAVLLEQGAVVGTGVRIGTRSATTVLIQTFADSSSSNTTPAATDRSFFFLVFGAQ